MNRVPGALRTGGAVLPGLLAAQDAEFIALLKMQDFEQGRPHLVALADPDYADSEDAPVAFEAFVDGTSLNAITTASVELPNPPGGSLTLEPGYPTPGTERFAIAGFRSSRPRW